MKADFAQVWFTPKTESKDNLVSNSPNQGSDSRASAFSFLKVFLLALLLVGLGVTAVVISASFVLNYEARLQAYEDKLLEYKEYLDRHDELVGKYEGRIVSLENDLGRLVRNLMAGRGMLSGIGKVRISYCKLQLQLQT